MLVLMSTTDKTFTISGMSCGGCVNSLTRVLTSVPGHRAAQD